MKYRIVSVLSLGLVASAWAAEPASSPATSPAAMTTFATATMPAVVKEGATLERLATGLRFVEGPVWMDSPAGGYLIFSDIPANKLYRWSPDRGLEVFREPSRQTNGNTKDPQGRLISCEHAARRVTRTEADGTLTVLAEKFEGKKFYSPNDAAVAPDGCIWFTDPSYGLSKNDKADLPGHFVFRLNPATSEIRAVATDFDQPNGLCFSPDGKRLYVADSGKPHHVRAFDVTPEGTLANSRVLCTISPGVPDGMRTDAAGTLYVTAGDGVQLFSPEGTPLGLIPVPESPANLCFGGKDNRTLFITARKSLYRIELKPSATKP